MRLKPSEVTGIIKAIASFLGGEQKIDLTIANMKDASTDEFLQLVIPSSLILHNF
jgi:hypothetical protein